MPGRQLVDRLTISLGTGLSCLADHSICSSETICVVRECPLQTVSGRPIGHVTGTSMGEKAIQPAVVNETCYPPRMSLAVTASGSGGPAVWITILVAGIAAAAAITAAIVAALSARSTKRLELQAQRARELESRISERKIDIYKPMIEMLGKAISPSALINPPQPEDNSEKIGKFSTWIAIYGSDDTIKIYHNFMQAAFHKAPILVISRLFAEFIIAARRDIGYPETTVTALHLMGMRINDLYSENEYRLAMSLPFEELCRRENWDPPWLTCQPAISNLSPDRSSTAS
jgi:hypothetical protein